MTELPWLAQMALNTGRTYMTVVKVSGATGGKGEMKTLRGHCISFPQPLAPQRTADMAAQVRLPRTDMHQYMSFVFVGPEGQRERWAKLAMPFGDMATASYPMLIHTLKVLKAIECPHLPPDLVIDESDETREYFEGDKDSSTSLIARLHAGVTVESDELVVDADHLGNDGDNAAQLPQSGAFRGEGPPSIAADATVLMDHCFYGQSGGAASGDVAPDKPRDSAAAAAVASERDFLCAVRDLLYTRRDARDTLGVFDMGERVQLDVSPAGAYPDGSFAFVAPFDSSGRDQESRDGTLLVRLEHDNSLHRVPHGSVRRIPREPAPGGDDDPNSDSDEPADPPDAAPVGDAPPPPRLVVTIPRDAKAMNEFTDNARLIMSSYVAAFPLGEGVVRNGSLSVADARHLLLQWNPAISRNINLVYLLFNEAQRHGALQRVAAAVRNNNSAFNEFSTLINDPDIGDQLNAAIVDPSEADSTVLGRKLKRIMKVFNGMVPFTAAARKAQMGDFQAGIRFHGDPNFFNTLGTCGNSHHCLVARKISN